MNNKFDDNKFKLLKAYLKQTSDPSKTTIYVAKDKVTNKFRSIVPGFIGFSESLMECLESGSFNLYASIIVDKANKTDKLYNVKDVHLYEAYAINLAEAAQAAKLL